MGVEPYIGLRPYAIGDQDRFYGRSRECRDVSALWRGNRVLILYGPSGVGKTSLLQAGVIARLDQETADVLPVGRISYSSAFPTADLPKHNPYDFALLSSWSPDESPTNLVGVSLTEFLCRRDVRTNRYGDPLPVLGAIDQFEEFFGEFPHRQRYLEEFIDHLANAIEALPSLRLLISIRGDAVANLLPYETRLARYSRGRFRVLPLTRDAALEAVTGPLVGTGRSFAPGVAEKLVDDLSTTEIASYVGETTKVTTEFVEPAQLQVVCTALWRALPEDVTTITEEHLHYYGDIRTVAELYTRTVAEVANDHQIPEQPLYDWLEQIFITKHGSRSTVYVGVSETGGMPNPLTRALEDRGILKSRQRAGSSWYELQHDLLIEPIRQSNRPRSEEAGFATSPAAYLRTAETALANGDLQLAQTHAEEALHICGDSDVWIQAEAESFLGKIAFQRGRLTEAEDYFLQAAEHFEALQDKAAVGRVLAEVGRVLLAWPPYADAVKALYAAVTRVPGDAAVQLELARALWFSGGLRAAAAVYGGVLAIAPGSAEALAGRGQILVELNDDVSALEDLDNLLRLQPEDIGRRAEVRAARALALARLGGHEEEAVSEADAAVEDAPHNGPVLLHAARVNRVAGEPARAVELLHRAHEARHPALLPHQRKEVDRLLAEAA